MAAPESREIEICALPDLEAFVDRVLCDGRYVHTFQNNPGEAAERLGVVLSPEIAHELSSTAKSQLINRVWDAKLRARKTDPERNDAFPSVVFVDGGVVLFIVVAIVAIAIVAWVFHKQAEAGRQGKVNDNSPNRDAKL